MSAHNHDEEIQKQFGKGSDTPKSRNFIQWKGTDLCMDMWCECGTSNHYDGYFAYAVKCGGCGQVYKLGTKVEMEKADASEFESVLEDVTTK